MKHFRIAGTVVVGLIVIFVFTWALGNAIGWFFMSLAEISIYLAFAAFLVILFVAIALISWYFEITNQRGSE